MSIKGRSKMGWWNSRRRNAHFILTDLAASILANKGFSVEIEKYIKCPEDIAPLGNVSNHSHFFVDVYGERDGEIIIYECGGCKQLKLDWLRKHIGKTVHMPYIDQWCPKEYERFDPLRGRKLSIEDLVKKMVG